jgi:6-phosphogluconolactonase (cycloisomerase 2 family)
MRRFWGLALLAAMALLGALPSSAGAWSSSCCLPWDPPYQLVLSADGRFAYASSYNITLAMARDPSSGSLTVLDSYDVGGAALALSPDGTSLYASELTRARISTFKRNPDTGLLDYSGVWVGPPATPGSDGRYGEQHYYPDIEPSRDGHQLYLSDETRDSVVTLTRDPADGSLTYRGQVRSGDPGMEGLRRPGGLAISGDDRFLYVGSVETGGVLMLARASDGGLTFAGGNRTCDCGAGDLALAADGQHLFGGSRSASAIDRNPESGLVGEDVARTGSSSSPSGLPVPDDQIVPSPDGGTAWLTSENDNELRQLAFGPDGFTVVKTFRDGTDGPGLHKPRAIVMSPDGRNLYVVSGDQNFVDGATITVFKRDPSTNALSYVSLFEGPVFNGYPPGQEPSLGVTINDGDEYTNDPDVDLTVTTSSAGAGAFGFDVSNDGGFGADMQHFSVDEPVDRYPWTLATSGPEQIAKTVYIRSLGIDAGRVVSDGIVLDQRPPAVDAARLSAKRITLRAHDRISGVSQMQVTRQKSRPGAWLRYARSAQLPPGRAAVWVRVRDKADNRSHWRRAVGRKRKRT